ncbi:hypothetical protein FGO68_gene15180 [Halteria grandinella]|uniref:Paired domain-containing protein n=1 Tax=Halteria grandinella TaxID=5974 RepID=A0A8J8P2Z4_HALGN|nr:hypothetical protein FGO68_gene15180 [Halteria grandinella]
MISTNPTFINSPQALSLHITAHAKLTISSRLDNQMHYRNCALLPTFNLGINHFHLAGIRKRKQRKPYSQIDSDQRRQLLQLVEQQGLIIKEAAATLGINYSTAKTILQLYKKTGRIDKIETVPNMRITPVNILKDKIRKDTATLIGLTSNPATGGFSFPSSLGVQEGHLTCSENSHNQRNQQPNKCHLVNSDDEFGTGVTPNSQKLTATATNLLMQNIYNQNRTCISSPSMFSSLGGSSRGLMQNSSSVHQSSFFPTKLDSLEQTSSNLNAIKNFLQQSQGSLSSASTISGGMGGLLALTAVNATTSGLRSSTGNSDLNGIQSASSLNPALPLGLLSGNHQLQSFQKPQGFSAPKSPLGQVGFSGGMNLGQNGTMPQNAHKFQAQYLSLSRAHIEQGVHGKFQGNFHLSENISSANLDNLGANNFLQGGQYVLPVPSTFSCSVSSVELNSKTDRSRH